MELRARGWSVRAAAREVGVSRSAATNWTRGYMTYRNGVGVGFVPPLDRLAVRQISSRYLSEEERIEIADLRRSGLSMRAIADRLGRAPSTISRELRRNASAGALVARMQDLPPALMRSITWDQGTEMARHLATADKLGARPSISATPDPPGNAVATKTPTGCCGTPKGVTLANHSLGHLMAVEEELNNRPRMVLQDRCPADLFAVLLASLGP